MRSVNACLSSLKESWSWTVILSQHLYLSPPRPFHGGIWKTHHQIQHETTRNVFTRQVLGCALLCVGWFGRWIVWRKVFCSHFSVVFEYSNSIGKTASWLKYAKHTFSDLKSRNPSRPLQEGHSTNKTSVTPLGTKKVQLSLYILEGSQDISN